MKLIIVISFLALTSCVSGPKAGTKDADLEIKEIYNKFNFEAKTYHRSESYEFLYLFTYLKDSSSGVTIAGCTTLPKFTKKVKNWESLTLADQNVLIQGQNKPFIFINPKHWNRLNKEEREVVLFHELGHCYLNREHESHCNQKKSFMCDKLQDFDLRSYRKNPKPYFDELFTSK